MASKTKIKKQYSVIEDFPFNVELKYRSTLIEKEGQLVKYFIGAPEALLKKSNWVKSPSAKLLPLAGKEREIITDQLTAWSKESFRVLALAMKPMDSPNAEDNDLVIIGFAGMIDPPRPEVKSSFGFFYLLLYYG